MTTFVDLFCGAGGLSLGLQQAGWRPLCAVDRWVDAVKTYERNFPDHRCVNADLSALSSSGIAALIDERPDWVVGGPPCQGFSTVGRREREDPRNRLVEEFQRVVDVLRPRRFLIENVVGLRDMRFVAEISAMFEGVGYAVTPFVLAAADYGVPQLRRRILFVGDREGRRFEPPEPSHHPKSYVTVWEAIGDLPDLKPGEEKKKYEAPAATPYQLMLRNGSLCLQGHVASAHPPRLVKAISHIPDGGNRRHIPAELQPRSGFHNSYSRLHSAAPAVAVTQNMGKPSGTRCIHPFQDRGLTAREGARLQGFPDTFHFSGGIISQRTQVANAVSPILAERLARALDDEARWSESGPSYPRQLALLSAAAEEHLVVEVVR